MNRQKLIDTLHAQIDVNGHILGAAVGSGITAKYAEQSMLSTKQ
jgi:predicted TIM-barrel enzyme